jgi:hypothetical protein
MPKTPQHRISNGTKEKIMVDTVFAIGQYAVHKPMADARSKGHTVTHVPSGMFMAEFKETGARAEAIRVAKRLHKLAPTAGSDCKFGTRPSEEEIGELAKALATATATK